MTKPMHRIILDPDGSEDMFIALFVNDERSIEGFLVPIGFRDLADELFNWFSGVFKGQSYQAIWNKDRIEQLGTIIAKIPCWNTDEPRDCIRSYLRLDMTRLQDLTEGWIPVVSPYGDGILVVKNSD